MSDDLVKRLRVNRASLQMWLGEHLLEQYEKERIEAADRIEKLVAALDDMAQYVSRADWHYLKDETRKALEGKDD